MPATVVAANTTRRPVRDVAPAVGWEGEGICAISEDGRLVCWGLSRWARWNPPKGQFVAMSMGDGSMCAIRTDGRLVCLAGARYRRLPVPAGTFTAIGINDVAGEKCAIRTDGTLACWKDSSQVVRLAEAPEGTFTTVTAMLKGWCGLRSDGHVVCWGRPVPVRAPEGTFLSLSGSCAVRTTGEIACFGTTWSDDEDLPASSQPSEPPAGASFVAVSAIDSRTGGCALRSDGTLACWDGEHEAPIRTPAGTYVSVKVGITATCAVRPDRRAVCWGENDGLARPAPRVTLHAPEWLAGRTVTLRWATLSTAFAPVVSYDIERVTGWDEDGNPDGATPWLTGTTRLRATFRGGPGGTYWWRVRARDAEGAVSPWKYASTTFPEDDALFGRSSGWRTICSSSYYLRRASVATRRGAALTLDVATGGLMILATTCPTCGTIRIYVDGRPDLRVSLRSPTTCHRRIAWMSDNGEQGFYGPEGGASSTITISVVSDGRPVIIDGIVLGVCPDCS